MQKKEETLKHRNCMFISTCTQTHLQGTGEGGGGHLLAFSKALIKGMAEHTEGMGKEREKNNNS